MGTHPIFESDFDCLTDIEIGMTKQRRTVDEIRRARFLRRGPGGLLSQKDKENMGLQQESFDQTGDSRWSDITASSVGPETARKPIQEIVQNVGKRKSETMTAGNSNWEITDEQSTLRNEVTKSPPAKRRSKGAPAAEEDKPKKETREEKRDRENAALEAFKKQYEENLEHNKKVDEYIAMKNERRAAKQKEREEKRRLKEERRAEKRAAREAAAKEKFRLLQLEQGSESPTENEENHPGEDNPTGKSDETRTIAPVDSDTYLVEQQIQQSSSAEPSNRTYTIEKNASMEKAPETDGSIDPSTSLKLKASPGVSRTINSSEISVFSPKEKSTPLRAKEVFQKPKKPTKLSRKMDEEERQLSEETITL